MMPLATAPVFTLTVTLDLPIEVGEVPAGFRRVIPITGGTVDGPELQGEVLPGGADWNTLRPDGTVHVWARYEFRTSDDAIVGVVNEGFHTPDGPVDPAAFAVITRPVFEAAAGAPEWLNTGTFAGVLRPAGEGRVAVDVYRLSVG